MNLQCYNAVFWLVHWRVTSKGKPMAWFSGNSRLGNRERVMSKISRSRGEFWYHDCSVNFFMQLRVKWIKQECITHDWLKSLNRVTWLTGTVSRQKSRFEIKMTERFLFWNFAWLRLKCIYSGFAIEISGNKVTITHSRMVKETLDDWLVRGVQ